MARVDWNLTEQSDWYAAFLEALKKRKVEFPVRQSDLKDVMESAREALLVLKVERRRPIASIDSIRGDYAKRLVDNGVFPRNYLEVLRRQKKTDTDEPEELSEDAKRIAELENELAEKDNQLTEASDQLAAATTRLEEFATQPTPAQLLQRFVAETLAMALDMHEARGKPEHVRMPLAPKEEVPQFEKDRRKGVLPEQQSQRVFRPRIAVLADFVGSDTRLLNDALKDEADMRYLDAPAKFQGLKEFNANHGRIVMWTDHAGHGWESSLSKMGISYSRFYGSLPSLLEHLKGMVAEAKRQ